MYVLKAIKYLNNYLKLKIMLIVLEVVALLAVLIVPIAYQAKAAK
jgi:hypothetical protein